MISASSRRAPPEIVEATRSCCHQPLRCNFRLRRSLDDCGDAGVLLPEHVIHNVAAFRDVIPADFCSR